MDNDKQAQKSHMVKSQSVMNQLKEKEQQNATNNANLQGSTNEIQTMETDEGLTQ